MKGPFIGKYVVRRDTEFTGQWQLDGLRLDVEKLRVEGHMS